MTSEGSDTRRPGSQGPRCRSWPRYRIITVKKKAGDSSPAESKEQEAPEATVYHSEQLCLELLLFTPLQSTTSATIDNDDHAGSANRQGLSPARTLHRSRRRIRGSYGYGVGRACCRRATMTFCQIINANWISCAERSNRPYHLYVCMYVCIRILCLYVHI